MSWVRTIEARSNWNRQQILAHQDQSFRGLLRHAWENSPFYRAYYADHGIRETDLPDLAVSDLPILTKEILMEGFNRISTDPLLRYDRLEKWLQTDSGKLYEDRYVVIHTSGTSGRAGIFAYDEAAWTCIGAAIAVRAAARSRLNPRDRYRIALCAATHGHFAAVTPIRLLPDVIFDTRLCSVLAPFQETLDTLNQFKPERLLGYSSTLVPLAQAALEGKLEISPDSVYAAGEILTRQAAATIKKAWGVAPFETYSSTESACLAIRQPESKRMALMEDEHIFEILDSHDRAVGPGQSGRMVMTVLYNRALPLIRYDMRDMVTRGHLEDGDQFDSLLRIDGRVFDALPITLQSGSLDSLNPHVLNEFFVPGAHKFQFICETPAHTRIRYLASENIDAEVHDAFLRLLKMKGADGGTAITVERAEDLPADAKTGKHRLVVVAKGQR